jgi:hypothetical protein
LNSAFPLIIWLTSADSIRSCKIWIQRRIWNVYKYFKQITHNTPGHIRRSEWIWRAEAIICLSYVFISFIQWHSWQQSLFTMKEVGGTQRALHYETQRKGKWKMI